MDSYTKTSKQGYGSRIIGSIKGIIFGIILIIASFVLLWTNEGTKDMSKVAKTSIEIKAESVDPTNDGKLVSLTGELKTEEKLGDNLYLKAGDYLAISRKVEMYSWVQSTSTKTKENLGGSETTTTTYKYKKEWSENPSTSSSFDTPEGHQNPEKTLKSIKNTVGGAKIGNYNIDTRSISMPKTSKISLNPEILTIDLTQTGGIILDGGYLFDGTGSIATPQVGDIRISYEVLNNGTQVTVMGKQNGNNISEFMDGNDTLYRAFKGNRNSAISTLKTEYKVKIWGFRVLGFILMWVGLSMLFGPISIILSVVPFFAALSRGIIGIITFIIALVLSITTIIISMVLHNIFALIIAIAIIGFFIGKYLKNKNNKTTPNSPSSSKYEKKEEKKSESSSVGFDIE